MIWIALSNGIHLTSKLVEQIISGSREYNGLSCKTSLHYLRQVVGHVSQHVGWQMLFAALMLGQLKRPYHGSTPMKWYMPYSGIMFGLLFTQGTIAAECSCIGLVLTMMSFLLFFFLAHRSRLPWKEIPTLKFFLTSQITFLSFMTVYWSRSYLTEVINEFRRMHAG